MTVPRNAVRRAHEAKLRFETLESRLLLAGDGLQGFYFNDADLAELVEVHGDPADPQGPPPDAQILFPDPFEGSPPDMGNAPPGAANVADDDVWSIRWTGWVLIESPGVWTFHTDSNDGVRLWVGDQQLIDRWNTHTLDRDSANIELEAGWHPLKLEYFQQNGSAAIRLLYEGPGQDEIVIPQSSLCSTNPNLGDPIADAGPDRIIFLPETTVTLDGTGTDDGTIVSYQWTQLSGPADAVLDLANSDDLVASELMQGSYQFQLTVTDDQGRTDDDVVTVTVAPTGGGGAIHGELKKWHKISIDFEGPTLSETSPVNPFLDYRLDVTFTHTDTGKSYVAPGYFAADGAAANSHAAEGNVWRVHFAPDEVGEWTYVASFRTGASVAVSQQPAPGISAGWFDGAAGAFLIAETDKTGRDFRGKGRLDYVGQRYLQFQETGEYFLKQGADAPENLLAYQDFDGSFKSDGISDNRIKSYDAHIQDWNAGDPAWDSEEDADEIADDGRGLIGAINYLASEGLNAFSFLPMNIEGDDKNVFPYLDYNERLRFDVSRLDQWEILFEHADHLGMFLHFKTQETENELLLDGGNLGTERKLYYRELIARFSHHLALNWNLGEEINNATTSQKQAWAEYFWAHDPYRHHIVIHNGANHYDLLGPPDGQDGSYLTGFSLQTNRQDFANVHESVRDYLTRSIAAGRPWAVAVDEPGDAQHAIRPDNDAGASHEDGRKNALWGALMAGAWGNEYYFGYAHAHSDLTLEDFRSRDQWWDYPRHALQFFNENHVPFWDMANDNQASTSSSDYALVEPGKTYVVYLKEGGTTDLDLSAATGAYTVHWFDPRNGGALALGSTSQIEGDGVRSLGFAPSSPNDDWTVLVRRIDADFDRDGNVRGDDFLAWQRGYGALPPAGAKANGDADNDQDVDQHDLIVWEQTFGQPLATPTPPAQLSPAAAQRNSLRPTREQLIDAALAASLEQPDEPIDGQLLKETDAGRAYRYGLSTMNRLSLVKRGDGDEDAKLSLGGPEESEQPSLPGDGRSSDSKEALAADWGPLAGPAN